MDYKLGSLPDVLRSLGRGVVFYATDGGNPPKPERWNGTDPLELEWLGDTEGDIVLETNATMEALTLPELTGGAAHEMDYTGEGPVLTIPLYTAGADITSIISPFGTPSAGLSRRAIPVEHTLVVFPEALFIAAAPGVAPEEKTLTYAGGVWTFGGQALDSVRQGLMANAIWLWRGWFTRPNITYHGGAGDARKNIETVTFTVGHHPDMPEGHHLYTLGDPSVSGIDIEGTS